MFNYEIKEHIGVISERENGWKKEVNVVSWNGREPKLDIREWSPNHDDMHRGITFSFEEAVTICELLSSVLAGDSKSF